MYVCIGIYLLSSIHLFILLVSRPGQTVLRLKHNVPLDHLVCTIYVDSSADTV
jgi:hypothetical protein